MNPNEYDVNYSGSYRPRTPNYARNHDYDRGSLSTRNDYDVDSMLSSRSLVRDNPRWDRRSVADNYDRRSEVAAPPTQYSRADSPQRSHAYPSYRGSEYDKPEPVVRREHSPIMKPPRTATFKGFTTPLPGNDFGYDDVETKRMRYIPPPEPERSYKGLTSSSLHESSYKDPRFRYSGCRDQNPDDYPPEAVSNMRGPPRRYVPDFDSVSTRNHEYDGCDRSWDGGGPWCDNTYHPGEQSLSPKTFKKECQRAYKEARAQRMRNLEEGLYGKCDWATFDSKYC